MVAIARVVQLAETLDLGSRCWGFESLHGYQFKEMDMNVEAQAEECYYEFSQVRGLQYPWNMLDENNKDYWRRRVLKDI